eukprot:8016598-Ditylum_brightwellii.AAC.1
MAEENSVMENPSMFKSCIEQLPEHIQQFLGNFLTQDVDNSWLQELEEGNVQITSDWLVVKQHGYFAVVLHMEDDKLHFQGPHNCHGNLISSYHT